MSGQEDGEVLAEETSEKKKTPFLEFSCRGGMMAKSSQRKPPKKRRLRFWSFPVGAKKDLNLRPLAPHASALAGLRHAPN